MSHDQPHRVPEGWLVGERSTDTWVERVRAADAEAESRWADVCRTQDLNGGYIDGQGVVASVALIAIAAELRAARIARRPGSGQ